MKIQIDDVVRDATPEEIAFIEIVRAGSDEGDPAADDE